MQAIDIAGWMEVMERIAKETYEGKLQKGDLDPGYILETYKELNSAAGKGYGKDWIKVNGATGTIAPEVIKMQQNIFKFSAAKNNVMLEEINGILQKNKSWNEFKNEVLKLNPKYNKNYLQAEWQTAKQAALHASNWEHYLDNQKLYPNLKYKTQGDERVRDEHKALNEVIAPINSDFWKTHYPPNGWRCRCYVVQTAEPATKPDRYPKLSEKDFPLEFRGNVGISGQIFNEDNLKDSKAHPYFALSNDSNWKKSFELSKLSAPANEIYKKGDHTVKVSPYADEKDLFDNITDAKRIVEEFKVNVEITAHLDGRILKDVKNPEYIIDKEKADRKAPTTDNVKNLRNIYKSATKQGCDAMVMNLKQSKLSVEEVQRVVKQKFETFPQIKTVYIIDQNDDCFIMQKQPKK